MGKFVVNGAIDATSHITIKNGADLYLQAPASAPDDSGDLIFTKYDGTEQGRIWISGGIGMIRFSSSDASKTLIHSSNYNSYSPTLTGGGASGTWGINISGTATYASYLSPMNSTTTNASTWDGAAESGGQITWRQAFKYSSFSEDTGDIVFKLRKNNGTELCLCIDGDYYSMGNKVLHAGNWSSYCAPASHSHSYLPLSGGTLTGNLNVGSHVSIWSDSEGGNISLRNPNNGNNLFQFDRCYADGLRLYASLDGGASSTADWAFYNDGRFQTARIIGTDYTYGLRVQSLNRGSGAGWTEGIWIEPAANGYATLALGKTDRSSVIALVHHSNGNDHYLEKKNSRGQWTYQLPEVTGTLINSGNIGSQSVNYANTAGWASSAGDAGTLNGWYASGFIRKHGWWTNGDTSHHADTTEDGIVFAYTGHGVPAYWGTLCTFGYGNGRDYNLQLHGTGNNQLFFRNRSSDFGQGSWQRVQVVTGWGSTNPNSAGIRGTNTGDVYYVY